MTKCLFLVLSVLLMSSPCQAQVDKDLATTLYEICVEFEYFKVRLAEIASNSLEFAPHNVAQAQEIMEASTVARTASYGCLHISDIRNIALMADNTDVNDFVKTYLPNLIGQYRILWENEMGVLKIILKSEMPQSALDTVQDLLEHLEAYLDLLDVLILKYK